MLLVGSKNADAHNTKKLLEPLTCSAWSEALTTLNDGIIRTLYPSAVSNCCGIPVERYMMWNHQVARVRIMCKDSSISKGRSRSEKRTLRMVFKT